MTFSEKIYAAEAVCDNGNFGTYKHGDLDCSDNLISAILAGEVNNQVEYEMFQAVEPVLEGFGYNSRSIVRVFSRLVEIPVVASSLEYGYITTKAELEKVLIMSRMNYRAMNQTEYDRRHAVCA